MTKKILQQNKVACSNVQPSKSNDYNLTLKRKLLPPPDPKIIEKRARPTPPEPTDFSVPARVAKILP